MDFQPIRNDADYKAALREVSRLVEDDPDRGTPAGNRLDALATAIQAYESAHHSTRSSRK